MVVEQLTEVPQVYTGRYQSREQILSRVTEVDNDNLKESLQKDVFVAVNIENCSKVPVVGKVLEIHGDKFKIQYWKGSWRTRWQPWLLQNGSTWEDELPVACVLLVNFKLDNNGKLPLGTYRYLKEAYENLAGNI